MITSIEEVCNDLPHFGTITSEGKTIEIWAKPINHRNFQEYHKAGIYCIENWRSNKIYIGMSSDISNRIKIHKRELNPNTIAVHHNPGMYEDSLLYGIDNFSFGVIETFDDNVKRDFLLQREEEWIRYYENQSSSCIYNKNRCTKYGGVNYTSECDRFNTEEKLINTVLMNDENRPLMRYNSKETKSIIKSVRVTESVNKLIEDSPYSLSELIERGLSSNSNVPPSQKEKFPIEYLISDVLQMKVIAFDMRNDKLFGYVDYLERRLMQYKKGEIEFI